MPIEVRWGNAEQTAVIMQFIGEWTWEEHALARAACEDLYRNLGHAVDLIIDTSTSTFMPRNALSNFRGEARRRTDHVRRIILVGNNAFARSMFSMFARIYPKAKEHFLMTASLQEALDSVQALDD